MTISYDFSKLEPLITPHSLILTPNARTQKAVIAGQFLNLEKTPTNNYNNVIQDINVQSFSQWQEYLWQELSFVTQMPQRISSLMIKVWLEKQIKHESAWMLTNPSGVAAKVLEAYQYLIQWCQSVDNVHPLETKEIEYFQHWLHRFEDFCGEKNLLAEFASLQLIVTKLAEANCLSLLADKLPSHILLVGFNELSPLEDSFLELLIDSGIKIDRFKLSIKQQHTARICFSQLDQELEFAANYAFDIQKNNAKNNSQSIAIVVEQLAGNLNQVHEAFSKVFHPEENKPWVNLAKPNYNVSAGCSLAEQPVIKSALKLLKINAIKLSLEDIHFLKNTHFIDWGNYRDEIRFFLYKLCLTPRQYYSFNYIEKLISQSIDKEKLGRLLACIQMIEQNQKSNKHIKQHISSWHKLLDLWQWAIDDNLTEFEILAKTQFEKIMNECDKLSLMYDNVTATTGLEYLIQIAKQQTFQIASDRTNVHILGMLEAVGLEFDQLLIVGFNNNNWPQKSKLNPFLPLDMQRTLNMPGNSADKEYNYAKSLSNLLLHSATNILVTSSHDDGGSSESSAPFFQHLTIAQESEFIKLPSRLEKVSDYTWHEDDLVVTKNKISGGAYLLSEYARCPFKSMSNFSLKLENYQMPEIGIDPKTKGAWLHYALELIFNQLNTQKKLLEMSDGDISSLIEISLSSSLQKYQAYLLSTTNEEVIQLEFSKLWLLIAEWIEIEKQRDEYSLDSSEKKYDLSLKKLDLNLRIDRVDIDGLGKQQIIDYKSGMAEINDWFGVRPTEAQMPAYVLALENYEISCLSYARLKTGKVAHIGLNFNMVENKISSFNREVGQYTQKLNKKLSTDNAKVLFTDWKKTLDRLSIGIKSGYVPVSPKQEAKTCQFCEYHSFCRINERQPTDQVETETETETASVNGMINE